MGRYRRAGRAGQGTGRAGQGTERSDPVKVTIKVNGSQVAAEVADRTLLVHFLREVANLTATNIGCDSTSCGACTVLLDGKSVKSCTVLAAQADGCEVTTVEGLADMKGAGEAGGGVH